MPPAPAKRGKFRIACLSAVVLFTFAILYLNFTFILNSSTSSNPSSLPLSPHTTPTTPSKTTKSNEPLNIRDNVHVIFSTDCSTFQSWQSYAVFASAYRVNQPGNITRIVSGCEPSEKEEMLAYHNKYINPSLSPNYHVHFTPSFDLTSSGKKYSFFNKPHGVNHFLQTPHLLPPTTLLILIDPDEFFLRPILNDFTDGKKIIVSLTSPENVPKHVTSGRPMSQQYGLGGAWTTWDIDYITGTKDSPAKKYSMSEAGKYFAGGPPYLAIASDFKVIAEKWKEFVGRAYEHKPGLLAEMYAWCIASAHLQLENVLIDSFMVSNIAVNKGEGWNLIDSLPSPVCDGGNLEGEELPGFLHLCQMNRVGEWAIHKRKVPRDIFSCESTMLAVPELDLGENYPYKTQGAQNGKPRPNVKLTEWEMKRTAFQVCAAVHIINYASELFKDRHCEGGGNREKVWKQSLE
ncbi:hypothetical protein TrVE_jg1132 [Triparma verrucosa]|uniref:Uncharacterized protein n=1 Tax=Triparma verrucosa TaxID=1606542 RepID=A0A9W7FLL0_9STRA|nr:hypothetical protein TrVE_jg1132 [Triparma verrucosa]